MSTPIPVGQAHNIMAPFRRVWTRGRERERERESEKRERDKREQREREIVPSAWCPIENIYICHFSSLLDRIVTCMYIKI